MFLRVELQQLLQHELVMQKSLRGFQQKRSERQVADFLLLKLFETFFELSRFLNVHFQVCHDVHLSRQK